MIHTINRDDAFPQLHRVLEGNALAQRLQQALQRTQAGTEVAHARVRRHYYKPGRVFRVLLDTRLRTAHGDERPQLYFGEMHVADKLEEAFRRAKAQPAALRLRPESMILWPFPCDPYLPGLATLADATAMQRRIQQKPSQVGLPPDAEVRDVQVQLSKYVPARRCGFTYRVRWRAADGREAEHTFFGKTYKEGHAAAAFDIVRRIESSSACRSGRLRIPRAYGYDTALQAVWQEWVTGKRETKNPDPEELSRGAARVAAALAALHASEMHLAPGKGMPEQIQELEQAVRRIASRYPDAGPRCKRLVQRLRDVAPHLPQIPLAPMHGSFKGGHILHEIDHVTVIDFDGAGLGDPIYDVGRYIARLEILGMTRPAAGRAIADTIASFRSTYAAGVTWGWPEQRVRWYTSAHLISSQAHKSVKRLAPQLVEATLERAESWFPADLLA